MYIMHCLCKPNQLQLASQAMLVHFHHCILCSPNPPPAISRHMKLCNLFLYNRTLWQLDSHFVYQSLVRLCSYTFIAAYSVYPKYTASYFKLSIHMKLCNLLMSQQNPVVIRQTNCLSILGQAVLSHVHLSQQHTVAIRQSFCLSIPSQAMLVHFHRCIVFSPNPLPQLFQYT